MIRTSFTVSKDNGDWQTGHLSGGALAELLFWLGKPGAAPSGALRPVAPLRPPDRRQDGNGRSGAGAGEVL